MRATILMQGSMIRATYGILAMFFPKLLFRSVGMKRVDDDARYLNRLFGGRDLTVAALTVDEVRRGKTADAAILNLACEATDTIALLAELRASGRPRRALVVGIGFNIVGYVTWIRALLARPPEPEAGDEAV